MRHFPSQGSGGGWIGDDENHIPVKIRAKLKIGAAEVYYKDSYNLRARLLAVSWCRRNESFLDRFVFLAPSSLHGAGVESFL